MAQLPGEWDHPSWFWVKTEPSREGEAILLVEWGSSVGGNKIYP